MLEFDYTEKKYYYSLKIYICRSKKCNKYNYLILYIYIEKIIVKCALRNIKFSAKRSI